MARLPKITVQGWTADGPAYTVHHAVAGFRNRKARRAGTGGEELVGDHDAIDEDLGGPAAYMVLADGDTEVYAFKGGHVYQVTLLVDGDPLDVLVDARGGDRIEKYAPELELLEQRALEGDELEAALEGGPVQSEQPITALTGAQVEQPHAPPAAEAPADEDEPSTGDHDYEGTVPEFVELLEAFDSAELESYVQSDSRKGVREAAQHELDRRAQSSSGDDEDAVGGDGDLASDEEE